MTEDERRYRRATDNARLDGFIFGVFAGLIVAIGMLLFGISMTT